jgi:nucleotide-binding universal stress UspA family protein
MSSPIIVGLALRDDDAAALDLALALARVTGSPLTLAAAVPFDPYVPATTPEYALALHKSAAGRLESIAAPLRAERTVTTHVREGSTVGMLHDLAEQTGAAAVVVGSSHRGAVGRVLAGDVAAGLLHGAPCAVVVAPRGYAGQPVDIGRIGVAYVDSDEGRVALDTAAGIAALTGGWLEVVTVVSPEQYPGTYAGLAWAAPVFETRDELRDRARALAEAAIAGLDPRLHGEVRVLDGPVCEALARVSDRFDLLICGSRGYGAFRGAIAGSISRGLAHRAECPLMLVPRALPADAMAPWHARDVATTAQA